MRLQEPRIQFWQTNCDLTRRLRPGSCPSASVSLAGMPRPCLGSVGCTRFCSILMRRNSGINLQKNNKINKHIKKHISTVAFSWDFHGISFFEKSQKPMVFEFLLRSWDFRGIFVGFISSFFYHKGYRNPPNLVQATQPIYVYPCT